MVKPRNPMKRLVHFKRVIRARARQAMKKASKKNQLKSELLTISISVYRALKRASVSEEVAWSRLNKHNPIKYFKNQAAYSYRPIIFTITFVR